MSINSVYLNRSSYFSQPPSEEKSDAARKQQEAKQTAEAEEKGRIEIDHEKGHFMIDGEPYSLATVFSKVGSKVSLYKKESFEIPFQRLQDMNKNAQAAVGWVRTLKILTWIDSPDGAVSAEKVNQARKGFEDKYGFDPFEKFSLSDQIKISGSYKPAEMDKLIEGTKSFLGTIRNDQQELFFDIERYNGV